MRPARGSSAGRQRLDAVSALLWPPPETVTLTRRPSRRSAANDWLVVPTASRPWVLLPAEGGVSASALARDDLGQRNRRAVALARALHRRRLLTLLPLTRVRLGPGHGGAGSLEARLREEIGAYSQLVVRLGRAREGRHAVLRPIDTAGETVAYVKAAGTTGGKRALAVEADNLRRIAELAPEGIIAPELISHWSWGQADLLALSPLVGDSGHDESVPAEAMRRLALAAGTSTGAVAASGFWRGLRAGIGALPDGATAEIAAAADGFETAWGDLPLTFGSWHGDWVPWNMTTRAGDVLLWDWEHFAEGVPLGFDLIHYTAQELRMTVGTDPRTERRWLAEAVPVLRSTFDLSGPEADATVLAYLIQVNLRYLTDRRDDPAAVPRRGWGLPMLARLVGDES